MLWIAFKMLIGNRGKYIAMVAGVFFAALIMTQQMGIFTGLISRTFGFITDTQLPDLWIVDPKVQFIDDIKPMQETKLLAVRGIEGVEWAVPLYKGSIRARLPNGRFQTCNVIGIDDASLIGGPPVMVAGSVGDLRRADSVIVDEVGAAGKLAGVNPDGSKRPLAVGDVLELNDARAVVVGLARVTRTFQSQPVVYTTYSRAMRFAPRERRLLSFVLAKVRPGADIQQLKNLITTRAGLSAYTAEEFTWLTVWYFMKNTGIPINFGIAVVLGIIIGTAVAGQTFYAFITDNIKYLGTLKAMGASAWQLIGMTCFQAVFVGAVGYGLGLGVGSLFFILSKNSELAFRLPWQIPAIVAAGIFFITTVTALISLIKVLRVDPATVFKG